MNISVSLFEFINAIILFSISLVGIVLCFIIYLKRESNFSYNHYTILLILTICLRLSTGAIFIISPNSEISRIILNIRPLFLLLLPLQYLYIKALLLRKRGGDLKDLYHLILPVFFTILLVSNGIEKTFAFTETSIGIIITYCSAYLILSIYFVSSFNKKTKRVYAFENKQEFIRKKWMFQILSSVFLALIILFYSLFKEFLNDDYLFGQIYTANAVLWLYCFVILFKTPDFLYGINYTEEKNVSNKLWLKKPKNIILKKDIELNIKIFQNIKSIQKSLEEILETSKIHRNDFSDATLAIKLNIPVSHVRLIFKYYSNFTLSELKHYLRINDAIKIIKNNKGDILLKKVSTVVGYKTYSSFYREYNKYKDL